VRVIARRLALVPAWVGVAALVLGGCSDLTAVEARKSTPATLTSSSAVASQDPAQDLSRAPSGAPSALPTPPAPSGSPSREDQPAGPSQRVEVDDISFEVPRSWIKLDAGELADGATDSEVLKEFADRAGVTLDQLREVMRGIDLYMIGADGARDGYVDNLNVIGQLGGLPNDSQIELSLARFGAEGLSLRHATSDAGDVAVASYHVDIGGRRVNGAALVVGTSQGNVVVTVSAIDKPALERVVTLFLGSVKSADPALG